MTALVLASFPIAALIFAAMVGIPLWLTFKRPDRAPQFSAAASSSQSVPAYRPAAPAAAAATLPRTPRCRGGCTPLRSAPRASTRRPPAAMASGPDRARRRSGRAKPRHGGSQCGSRRVASQAPAASSPGGDRQLSSCGQGSGSGSGSRSGAGCIPSGRPVPGAPRRCPAPGHVPSRGGPRHMCTSPRASGFPPGTYHLVERVQRRGGQPQDARVGVGQHHPAAQPGTHN